MTSSSLFFSAAKLTENISVLGFSHIYDAVLSYEEELTRRSEKEIREELLKRYGIMKEAVKMALENPKDIKPKVADPSTHKINAAFEANFEGLLNSPLILRANLYAIAVMECNASMGRIVAAPTAGSAGVIPGAMIAMQEHFDLSDEEIINALLVSSGIGLIIAANSTFSAAAGGCQVEVGASSCMAAAALAYLQGLNPEKCISASALSLQNMLGLACDPIGGLVEIPCIKRNGFGVSNAFLAADMVKMGLIAEIPFDEVVKAMNNIAQNMHSSIRETSKGGLAITPTAIRLVQQYRRQIRQNNVNEGS